MGAPEPQGMAAGPAHDRGRPRLGQDLRSAQETGLLPDHRRRRRRRGDDGRPGPGRETPAGRDPRMGESHTHWHPHQRRDITTTAAAGSGRRAYDMAGIGPEDVDIFQPYDAFTITPILQLEDLGFCAKGAGGEMFAQGHFRPGGKLPAMTSGGGLSYTHPGAFGIFLVIEAVRQLRGEAGDRQVHPGPRCALVNAIGGLCSYSSTVVLTHD
ncbi:thiolase C-terminal domain-containing protein [Actinomadura madurae]